MGLHFLSSIFPFRIKTSLKIKIYLKTWIWWSGGFPGTVIMIRGAAEKNVILGGEPSVAQGTLIVIPTVYPRLVVNYDFS